MSTRRAVTVVGVGDDGCLGLSSRAMGAVARAQVLAGGERHLAFFPEFGGRRVVLDGNLTQTLGQLAQEALEDNVCILASGDPLFFGVGGLVARTLGAEHVEFLPHPSSVQWAFARVGISWEDARVVSLHGRSLEGLAVRMRQWRKVACFTDGQNTPQRIAQHLLVYGQHNWQAWVCENLAGPGERVRAFTLAALAQETDVGPLNVLVLARTPGGATPWAPPASLAYLPEEAFARKTPKIGLITKREVRALSLAQMALHPAAVVWDVGAGSGSVAIEAALMATEGRVFAIEMDAEGAAMCRENARTHGADNVQVIEGRAPEALAGLEAPHAVFVGGTRGDMPSILSRCLEALLPGGQLVINAVTLENLAQAHQALRDLGYAPEMTLVQISRGSILKGQDTQYTRYEALNPIHMLHITKPEG